MLSRVLLHVVAAALRIDTAMHRAPASGNPTGASR
jgi:hypothetical protein